MLDNNILNIVGIIGAILGIVSIIPQVFKVFKEDSADGLDAWFLALWLGERIMCFAYAVGIGSVAFTFKYGTGILLVGVLCWFKVKLFGRFKK